MLKSCWLAILVILFFNFRSYARPTPYLTIGIGQGGSQLSKLTGNQDYNIAAGSGLLASGGFIFPISPTVPHFFEGQIGLGLIYQDDVSSKANRVSWTRLPVDALYFYRNTRELFRLGWGITYHLNGEISARGANASAQTNVDHALGWVLVAEKFINSDANAGSWSLGVRYTKIQYNLNSFDQKADGSAFQLTMTIFAY